jgi:hypothetical protein
MDATKKMADILSVFAEVQQPKTNYLAYPIVSSVYRIYNEWNLYTTKVDFAFREE